MQEQLSQKNSYYNRNKKFIAYKLKLKYNFANINKIINTLNEYAKVFKAIDDFEAIIKNK